MAKTILLVDDVQMFNVIHTEFLQESQVNVRTAKDGVEALYIIKTDRPDLIFMDLEMPRMNGAACCEAIKSDPMLINIPVVMITSSRKEEDRELCVTAGCNHILYKPVSRDTFLEVARRFLPEIERRENRISCNLDGIFIFDNKTLQCKLYDLSVGGAFIVSDRHLVLSNIIQISFAVSNGIKIECPARVTWVNRSDSKLPQGFGVKFARMPRQTIDALKDFIEAGRKPSNH